MDIHEIKQILMANLSLKEVYVSKDAGNNHYQVNVIDNRFINMSTLQRQKIIYAVLMQYILNGDIHSLSIHVFTVKEWEQEIECIVK